jgi:hypothetical protein
LRNKFSRAHRNYFILIYPIILMSTRGKFRVLSTVGTICRIAGWILVALAIIAAVTAAVTVEGWQAALTGASVFLGSLVGGLLLVAQGQLIKCVVAIEKHTRP